MAQEPSIEKGSPQTLRTSGSRPVSVSSESTLREDLPPNPFGERPRCFKSTLQECLFVLIATMAVAQNTILTGSLRSVTTLIARDLRMNDAQLTWIIAGQSLTSGAFLLFFGRFADLFGRRRLLLCSMAMFCVFLIISGFATNGLFFDAFMGLCGLGCAAVVPPAVGILGAAYDEPSKRKNRAFSVFAGGYAVGLIFGSFIAGVVTVITTWRAIMWVLAVLYAVLTLLAWFVVPVDDTEQHGGWNMDTLRHFDLLGVLLATVGIAAVTAALTEAGVAPNGWATNYVIALLVIGVVLLLAFLYWEKRCDNPVLPIDAWKDRNFTLLVIILCFGYNSFQANSFWLTLAWQNVYNNTPIMIAAKFLPTAIGGLIMCVVASLIIHRVNNKTITIVAAISMVISSALLGATNTNISYWALTFLALIFSVISQDFQFCVTNLYVVSSLPKEQRSVAGGLVQTTTRLMATIGLGVQTSVFKAVGGATIGPESTNYKPYLSGFWMSIGGAVIALFFLPFLTIGTQGNSSDAEEDPEKGGASNSSSDSG